MRGIAHQPHIPLFEERYRLKPAALAVYPMYKGLAQLVGMKKIEGPQTIKEQFERYLAEYDNFDFFFIHYKYTDKYGEDGNFAAKKKAIEEFDAALPILLRKKPDVLAITGDHSTPVAIHGHSWHPQPVLLHSANSGSDKLQRFTETGANTGSLGIFEAKFLIRLMQANARMFDKFGAKSPGVRACARPDSRAVSWFPCCPVWSLSHRWRPGWPATQAARSSSECQAPTWPQVRNWGATPTPCSQAN
jgi:2,3-bisphosphoglycerate-independent phosphoglycerate mutase